eukprot:Nitzschia sp. Nitz4//scaffold34_size148208//20750//22171//NITZ4_002960-RA/size148208-processed-gene-0.32-mRNA-1//-1//CDS//3329548735//622//frame0
MIPSSSWLPGSLLLAWSLLGGLANLGSRATADAQITYANVTLKNQRGDLSAVIYLPQGIKPGEPTYYMSTRFEHGSMIGNIERVYQDPVSGKQTTHILYGTKQWRVPHDPYWPESGVGLASEFGVGDDGAFCNYRCGWYGVNDVTNGVLGYLDARNGDSFLKIGVGELVKGSCPTCDSTDDYKFNSPYAYAEPPVWTMEQLVANNGIALENQAVLGQHGYKLRKEITLNDDHLVVKSLLTNLGSIPFATAWYSHHFFTCDSRPVEKGYGLDLDVVGTQGAYDEPAAWFWSTPLDQFATVTPRDDVVSVDMLRGLDRSVRIKAEFSRDDQSHGSFSVRGCNTAISEIMPEVGTPGGVSMYAYNLYVESGTFSPEPQIYMRLEPGETKVWTQQLQFTDMPPQTPSSTVASNLEAEMVSSRENLNTPQPSFIFYVLSATCVAFCIQSVWQRLASRRRCTQQYTQIPDDEQQQQQLL